MKLLIVISLLTFSADVDSTLADFKKFIQKKDLSGIESILSKEIDLEIDEEIFIEISPKKTVNKLKDFFCENKITSVECKHTCSSGGNKSKLYICEIKDESGEKYRVSIYYEKEKLWKISSIDITKDSFNERYTFYQHRD